MTGTPSLPLHMSGSQTPSALGHVPLTPEPAPVRRSSESHLQPAVHAPPGSQFSQAAPDPVPLGPVGRGPWEVRAQGLSRCTLRVQPGAWLDATLGDRAERGWCMRWAERAVAARVLSCFLRARAWLSRRLVGMNSCVLSFSLGLCVLLCFLNASPGVRASYYEAR